MPHDGQTLADLSPVLDGLRDHVRAACAPVGALLARATERLRADVAPAGRIDPALLEARQSAAHGLAWLATYAESVNQMSAWVSMNFSKFDRSKQQRWYKIKTKSSLL